MLAHNLVTPVARSASDQPVRLLVRVLVALCLLLSPLIDGAVADTKPSIVIQPVTDQAGVIDAGTEKRLEGYLWELKQKTGAELGVVTIDTTDGVPIEMFALELAERSGLGSKQRDDGCLVLVAVKDRKYRIETGYGIEGIIPDGLAGDIGRQYFQPYFKANDYAGGIEQGVLAIAHLIAKDKGISLTGVPTPNRSLSRNRRRSIPTWLIVVIVIFAGVLPNVGRRFPRGTLWYLLLLGWINSTSGRRHHGGWGGSSGFGGGGGFGSFGGGGGGFGGGGSSGSW